MYINDEEIVDISYKLKSMNKNHSLDLELIVKKVGNV